MKIPDANVLLYCVNDDSPQQAPSRAWLDSALIGDEPVGFAWLPLIGFLRISTHPAVFAQPLAVSQACAAIDKWLAQDPAELIQPDAEHIHRVAQLLSSAGTGGNLVNDAHLAALAVQHKAVVVSFDNDFDRFPGVRWERPQ